MLKVTIDRDHPSKKVFVDAEGDIEELCDDVGNVVSALYNHLKTEDAEFAQAFKSALQGIFADDGPVWMNPEELKKEGCAEC